MRKLLGRLGLTKAQIHEILCVGGGSIAFLLLFFSPYVFNNFLIYSGDFGSSDLLELNIPRRILAVQAMQHGHLPLWEPKLSNGLPLLAEGQTGIFNPLNIGFYFLFNSTLATNLAVITTLLIALLGCYWLARRLGAKPLPAWLGALAFALGGVFIFRLRNLNTIHTMAYLPWIIAVWHGYLRALAQRRSYWGWLMAFGVILTLQILSGHPHMTYLCWLVGALAALAGLIADSELSPQTQSKNATDMSDMSDIRPDNIAGMMFDIRPGNVRAPWRSRRQIALLALGQVLAVCLFSVLLCAIQLLPTYELSQLASRSKPYTWEALKEFPFTLKDLAHLVCPYCYGNPALGSYERAATTQGVFWEVTAYLGLIPLLLSLSTWALWKQRRVQLLWAGAIFFLVASLGPQGYLYGLFWKFCPGFDLFRCPSRFLVAFSLFMAVLAALGCQHWLDRAQQRWHLNTRWTWLLIAITVLDLGWVSYTYQTEIPGLWQAAPPVCAKLGKNPKVYTPTYFQSWQNYIGARGWRRAQNTVISHRNVLGPDLAAIWDVEQCGDSNIIDGGLSLRAPRNLYMYELFQVMSTLDERNTLAFNADMLTNLRLQGVTHILSYLPFRNAKECSDLLPEQTFVDPAQPDYVLHIYPVAKPLPKVRLSLLLCETPPEYMATMMDMFKVEPQKGFYEITELELPSAGTVRQVKPHNNGMTIECSCEQNCALIITQNFCPGWRAQVDEKEAGIARVNHAFQGIALTPGEHTVELTYQPASFELGWRVSIGTLFFLVLAGGFMIWKRQDD